MHLIDIIKETVKDKGIIVYGWLICEIINEPKIDLSKTDKKMLSRLLHKVEHKFNKGW